MEAGTKGSRAAGVAYDGGIQASLAIIISYLLPDAEPAVPIAIAAVISTVVAFGRRSLVLYLNKGKEGNGGSISGGPGGQTPGQ